MTTEQQQQYFPGLEGVIAGETAISTVTGGLRYRGYTIEDLSEKASFEEVAYLLLNDDLPTSTQLSAFRDRVAQARQVPDSIIDLYRNISPDVAAMDVLRTGVSAAAHFDPEIPSNEHDANVRKAERLLGVIPTLISARARLKRGEEPLPPRPDLDHSANFLYMLRGKEPDELERRSFDISLILYAEHEYNASTFTARVASSTLGDLHGAVVAAIAALKGPLHGGANEKAVEVLEEVGSADNAEPWIRNALANRVRVMGFGHRVYKTNDPRAGVLKRLCEELAPRTGMTEFEGIADTIERIMWEEKGLPANMDWPAGRLYRMLGLETEVFTPIFVASRITGWAAHVIEQHDNNRLIRPRANYVGPELREFVPLAERG